MITNPYFNKGVIISVVIAFLFAVFTFFVPQSEGGTVYEYETKLFDKDKVSTVDIKIDPSTWDEMIDNALQEEYVKCDVTINGETYYNVGIRPKGNTSLTQVVSDPDSDRLSFKIEFDHYVKGQTYYGLDKLVLNNNFKDATSMKEYLSYDLMAYLGMVTPLYTYTQISVNGESWGLYLALEGMEESFAMRNFGSNYGQLYKPETMGMNGGGMDRTEKGEMQSPPEGMNRPQGEMPNAPEGMETQGQMQSPPEGMNAQGEMPNPSEGMQAQGEMPNAPEGMEVQGQMQSPPQGMQAPNGASGKGGGADLVYTDDEIESYSTIFDSAVFKTNNQDYKRVIQALKQLNAGEDLEKYVDVPEVLKYIAANTVLVNLDSYFSNMQHNYYLYEEDGKISMLPWDYNLAFGGFQGGSATSVVNFPIDTPVSGVALEDRPMISKLLEVETYKEAYHGYLQEIVDGYFKSGQYEATINKIDALIGGYIKEDPTAFYTYEEYVQAVDTLKQFGIMRASSIDGQLKGEIPSTTQEQQVAAHLLIDASTIDLSVMGTQGGGEKGDMKGDRPSQMEDALSGASQSQDQALVEGNTSNPNRVEHNKGTRPEGMTENRPDQMMAGRPGGMENKGNSSVEAMKSLIAPVLTLVIGLIGVMLYKKSNMKYRKFYK